MIPDCHSHLVPHSTDAPRSIRAMGLRLAACLPLLLTLPGGGCSSIGPKVVQANYGNYNQAVADVLREELLLNVVRRRFYESPQFVAFGSISTSRSISGSASGNAGWSQDSGQGQGIGIPTSPGEYFKTFGASGSVTTADSPTFTITPQQGPEIAQRLHGQFDLRTLSLLAQAGYPADLILFLIVQDFPGVRAIDVGTGDSFRPGSHNYLDLLGLVAELSLRGNLVLTDMSMDEKLFDHPFTPENLDPSLILSATSSGGSYVSEDRGESYFVTRQKLGPALWIAPEAVAGGEVGLLLADLGLDPNPSGGFWPIRNLRGIGSYGSGEDLRVRARSFYGVLNLLAYGVEVDKQSAPEAFDTGRYRQAVADGQAPDLTSMFLVKQSGTKPRSAFVAARHGDRWYYIANSDRRTKQCFNALFDLYNLQVAPGPSGAGGGGSPLLTLPVR